MLLAVRTPSYGRSKEVWRALKKLDLPSCSSDFREYHILTYALWAWSNSLLLRKKLCDKSAMLVLKLSKRDTKIGCTTVLGSHSSFPQVLAEILVKDVTLSLSWMIKMKCVFEVLLKTFVISLERLPIGKLKSFVTVDKLFKQLSLIKCHFCNWGTFKCVRFELNDQKWNSTLNRFETLSNRVTSHEPIRCKQNARHKLLLYLLRFSRP